jgi:very-short-patch-repair endonuclease
VPVEGGVRNGKDINEPEAQAVVDLLEKLCADTAYDDMTFGVVSLLGTAQSQRIHELLFDRLGTDELEARAVRCGEPASFQGDERDVVVISTVVDGLQRIGQMADRRSERRMNVAASRARNQLWVVHSVPPDSFPAGDPRAELIRHCQNPNAYDLIAPNLLARAESPFEQEVLRRILQRGYRRVRAQHEVGRYRIDIVIEGPHSRLAVECDGDRWHGPEQWIADRLRQQKLERAGWTFERLRGSSFYRHPAKALEPLWARLDELGIPTGDWTLESQPRPQPAVVAGPAGPANVSTTSGAATATVVADDGVSDPASRALTPSEVPAARTTIEPVLPVVPEAPAPGTAPRVDAPVEAPRMAAAGTPPAGPSLRRVDGHGAGDRRVGAAAKGACEALAPYQAWEPRATSSVLETPGLRVTEELLEIVGDEGPVHALRSYQLHTKAAGGQRVGREMRHAYNQIVHAALRRGTLAKIIDDLPGVVDSTIYLPGRDPVVIRELGPRQLIEVPRSEIRTLIEELQLESGDPRLIKRAVLDTYGLVRLTEKASAYLDEVLTYTWRT